MKKHLFLACMALALFTAGTAQAQTTFFWTNSSSGAWGTAGNWTNELAAGTAPDATGQTNYTLNFDNAATYTASNNLNSGFLLNQLNFGGATATLADASLTLTNNGATLPQVNQNSAAAITINNDLVLGTDTTFGGSDTGTVTVAGAMSGAGSLTKAGTCTLVIGSTNNTYSGATVISGGTVQLSAGGLSVTTPNYSFDSPSVTSGTLVGAPATNASQTWTFSSGSIANGNNTSPGYGSPGAWNAPTAGGNANTAAGAQYGLFQASCSISQSLTFPVSGNYILTFGAAGRGYSTPANGVGTIQVKLDNVNQGAAISPTYNAWKSFTNTLTGVAAGSHTLLFQFTPVGSDNTTYFDYVQLSSMSSGGGVPSTTALSIASGATFDLNGGAQTIASLSDSGGGGGVVTNSYSTAATLTINPSSGSTTFSGAIRGPISLVKSGIATQVLAGASAYVGPTTVSSGTLLVNGSITGAVSVASGATLGGTGAITGNVTFATGGLALFTNDSPLTFTGPVTLNNNTVRLALPDNLAEGTYLLATNTTGGFSGAFAAAPVIDSGSVLPGLYKYIGTGTGSVSLVVSSTDTAAPTPNPMGFAVNPSALSPTSVVMTATTATDVLSPPVEYFFTNTVNGATSGWILSTVWTNTGLIGGTTYGFQVKARDAALNETANSAVVYAVPAPRTLYWDGGTSDIGDAGNGASAGGSGTWNTSTLNWDAGAAPHVAWISTNDTAVFGGTAGTVTLGENVTVGGLQFSASGYTIGGAKTLGFGAASSITNNTGNVTFTDGVCVTNFAGTVYIGYNNGNSGRSVTIENGGKWFGGNVYVGYAAGASANNNRYNVGGSGAASTVSNGAIFVGGPQSGDSAAAQGYNTMVVSNATLQMSGQLSIGFGGNTMNNNQVIVDNQGTVQMGNNSIVICASSYAYPYWNNNGLVITNGGYLSAGALTVNKGTANNYALVANGGTLVSVAAPAIKGLMTIVGGGSGGPTSTWNLTSNNLVTANGTLTVDGNGLAGGAVVTNAGVLIVGPDNSSNGTMLMTNGAQVFATSVVVGQSTGGSDNNNLLTIVGGAGVTSVLKAGGGSVTVGYMGGNGGINNNRLLIGAGGVLTNAGSMWVGYRPGGGQYNGFGGQQLVVTNGGQLFTTGNSGIGYDNSGGSLSGDSGSTATIGGTNSANGVRSLWDLGGGNLTVGFYNRNAQSSANNGLMVTTGGILTNAALITIGAANGNNNSYYNYMTVSNASISSVGLMIGNTSPLNTVTVSGNSTWNLGAGPVTVGSSSVSNVLAVTGGTLTNAGIVNIRANNTLSLAAGCQVFANSATNAGTMAVGIDTTVTPACGCLNVTSNLNVNTARLDISATGKPIGVFVIAFYGSLTGAFAATNGLPENCKLYMDYKGLKQIAIVGNAAGTIITFR